MKQVTEWPKLYPARFFTPTWNLQLEAIILKCMEGPGDRFPDGRRVSITLHDYPHGCMQAVNNGHATAMLPATPPLTVAERLHAEPAAHGTSRMRPQSATEQAAQEEERQEEAEAQPRACHRWRHRRHRGLAAHHCASVLGLAPRPTSSAQPPWPHAGLRPQPSSADPDWSWLPDDLDRQRLMVLPSCLRRGKIIEQTPGAGRTGNREPVVYIVVSGKGREPAASVGAGCQPHAPEAQDPPQQVRAQGRPVTLPTTPTLSWPRRAEQEPAAWTSRQGQLETITSSLGGWAGSRSQRGGAVPVQRNKCLQRWALEVTRLPSPPRPASRRGNH